MQLKWTDLALADLDHIETYIAADNSPLVAIDVVLRIIDTVDVILPEHPKAGRIGRVENTRELVIDGHAFSSDLSHHSSCRTLAGTAWRATMAACRPEILN
ncbi:MAG: type II toxin-antitoxin system RelE/ParE family toxin [Sedimenticolaceae bacterium]